MDQGRGVRAKTCKEKTRNRIMKEEQSTEVLEVNGINIEARMSNRNERQIVMEIRKSSWSQRTWKSDIHMKRQKGRGTGRIRVWKH